MRANGWHARRRTARTLYRLTVFVSSLALSSLFAVQTAPAEHPAIPAGTILPVILRTTISPQKTKPGRTVRGEIAQDVPLSGGLRIPKGTRIDGKVIQIDSPANAGAANISIRFDTLHLHGQLIPISTNLRAIAGFMEVLDARVPNQAVGEGDVSNWMTTTQIGGDSVFGIGGPVTSAHHATEEVGKSLMNGGVLARVSPNESGNCRGALGDNTAPQALWVFSSDACGTYGLSHVKIFHAGRSAPVGLIIFQIQNRKAKIQSGAGLLLRVIG